MDYKDLNSLRSVAELDTYQGEVRQRMTALNEEFAGLPFPEEQREEFARLTEIDQEATDRITELEARNRRIERIAESPKNVERIEEVIHSAKPTTREADIYDLSGIRTSVSNPEAANQELRDRARRANEYAHYWASEDRSAAQATVSDLLDRDATGAVARRILITGNPLYKTAWLKKFSGVPLTDAEASVFTSERAMSLTGSAGGFAVPFTLDATVFGTSNGNVNPFRQIARVVQIAGDEWRGVSSGAITASYAAEATETTDNSPTLAQPTISTEKAQAFIPFSIEIGMDWPGLEAELGGLLQEAKDDLEANKFTAGSGTNEPFGVLTGTTNTVNAAAGQTFTIANLYSLVGALPPRYQPRAAFVGNLAVANRIRQFDTAGGANLWTTIGNGTPDRLLGKPFYELSEMGDVATGIKFLLYGDFSRYVIVDRVGLSVDVIPHLFGTNHRPTGQRGLYAFWRNGAKVVDANAFRALLGVA
jgi:HK97 family phage major capsid protein